MSNRTPPSLKPLVSSSLATITAFSAPDAIRGAEPTTIVAKELETRGFRLGGVRLDSGDLSKDSQKIRKILDDNELGYVKIFASGDLDEFKIAQLLNDGAKLDAFGVGTKMGTSADRPYLDAIYKLCETMTSEGSFSPIMKLSKDKITLPGRKQVYRFKNEEGSFEKDLIALFDEKVNGEPLLVKVMEKGKLIFNLPTINEIRAKATENISKLPAEFKVLTNSPVYSVELSQKLQNLIETTKSQLIKNEVNNGASTVSY